MPTMPKTVNIDTDALENWIAKKGITKKSFGHDLGLGDTAYHAIIRYGYMNENMHRLMCKVYGLPDDAFVLKEPEPVKEPEPAPVEEVVPGWSMGLIVHRKKLCVQVKFDGKVVHEGWARVPADTELDLMKSISYAAHMVYKNAEADFLKNGGE